MIKKEQPLNVDRMVRSATSGTAGEPYCSLILEAIGLIDGSSWSLDHIEAFWEDAFRSSETVAQFINRHRIAVP